MQTRKIAAITALAIPLMFGGYSRSLHAQPASGTPAALGDDDDHYHAREAREMGHRDGIQAANEDMRDHRRPDADSHHNFRNPPVDKHVRDDYRAAFRDGYNDAMHNGGAQGVRDYDHHDDNR